MLEVSIGGDFKLVGTLLFGSSLYLVSRIKTIAVLANNSTPQTPVKTNVRILNINASYGELITQGELVPKI